MERTRVAHHATHSVQVEPRTTRDDPTTELQRVARRAPAEPMSQLPRSIAADLLWLQRLATRLVADEAEAEDAMQEVILLAITKGGMQASNRRAWLARVLRNLLARRRKRRMQRYHVERRAARHERVPSSADMAEALERQNQTTSLIERLDDHYAIVIRMRYLEGKSPREIARELSLPVETVRTRTRRGLTKLRSLIML